MLIGAIALIERPDNNEMQERTSHGPDGGSPLISVLALPCDTPAVARE